MKRPGVGTAVLINKGGRILIGKRKSILGEGTWCVPGGHLEFGESFEECVKRETEEEANIKIKNIDYLATTNDIFGDKHYVTIFMSGKYDSGEAIVTEFEEFYEWKWSTLDDLPSPLFYPLRKFIDNNISLIYNKIKEF